MRTKVRLYTKRSDKLRCAVVTASRDQTRRRGERVNEPVDSFSQSQTMSSSVSDKFKRHVSLSMFFGNSVRFANEFVPSFVYTRTWYLRIWIASKLPDLCSSLWFPCSRIFQEWFTFIDKDAKNKERYLFLFKARILVCKVRRISDDRSVFVLKDILKVRKKKVSIDAKRWQI